MFIGGYSDEICCFCHANHACLLAEKECDAFDLFRHPAVGEHFPEMALPLMHLNILPGKLGKKD